MAEQSHSEAAGWVMVFVFVCEVQYVDKVQGTLCLHTYYNFEAVTKDIIYSPLITSPLKRSGRFHVSDLQRVT